MHMTKAGLPEVRLRAMEPEDLDFIYGIENDTDVWDIGATNVPYSRYALYEYISTSKNDIYADRQMRLIIENNSKQIVGLIDLTDFDPRHMRAEIGIIIQKAHRHQGYAQSALSKVVRHAFLNLHMHQLYAVVDENNEVSLRLFRNTGFTQTAVLKDWLHMGDRYQNAYMLQLFGQKTE